MFYSRALFKKIAPEISAFRFLCTKSGSWQQSESSNKSDCLLGKSCVRFRGCYFLSWSWQNLWAGNKCAWKVGEREEREREREREKREEGKALTVIWLLQLQWQLAHSRISWSQLETFYFCECSLLGVIRWLTWFFHKVLQFHLLEKENYFPFNFTESISFYFFFTEKSNIIRHL